MSSIFKSLIRKNRIIKYLDDVFIQDTTTDTVLQTLDHFHKTLKNKNRKAAPEKAFFFLDLVEFLGHQIQNNHIPPLKNYKIMLDFSLLSQNKSINYKFF